MKTVDTEQVLSKLDELLCNLKQSQNFRFKDCLVSR